MYEASLVGLGISGLVLLWLVPNVVSRIRNERRTGYHGNRWGRIVYEIRRSGSFVDAGTSYRVLDTRNLSVTSAEILQEWFISDQTPKNLRSHYSCVCRLQEAEGWQGSASGV